MYVCMVGWMADWMMDDGVNKIHDWRHKISFRKCKVVKKSLVYSLTDGRIDGMMGELRG